MAEFENPETGILDDHIWVRIPLMKEELVRPEYLLNRAIHM